MTHTKQPDALQIAAELELDAVSEIEQTSASASVFKREITDMSVDLKKRAAKALRAQAGHIVALEAENSALREREEAIGAGGVTWLRSKLQLDRDAFERALVNHVPDAALECHEGQYASPYVQSAWTGFTFAAAIAQEGGK